MQIEVGSFTKSTGGAPVGQTVTLVNASLTPTFCLLWTIGNTTAESFVVSHMSAIGISAGGVSRSHAFASQDAAASSNTSQRGAAKALSIVQWGEALIAEADLSSFAAGQINLNWTTNDANAYHIGYLVGDVESAKVIEFTIPTSASDKAATGAGFMPDAVLMIGGSVQLTLPSSIATGELMMAAFDKWGHSWSWCNRTLDNQVSMVTSFLMSSGTDLMTNSSEVVTVDGTLRSMDNDGFTLNYRLVDSVAQRRYALCLKGGTTGSLAVGMFSKTIVAATVAQQVRVFETDRQLRGVFLSGIMGQRVANVGASSEARYGIGAADDSGHECAQSVTDQEAAANANVDAIFKTTKAYIDSSNVTAVIDAESDAPAMNDDGSFTMSWTTNDTSDTRIGFLAFADATVSGGGSLINDGLVVV
jgi:hypothetical protein